MKNNILFYLIPKSQVEYVLNTNTLRQTIEKFEYHGYTATPILTKDGKYFGTITEGDILKEVINSNFKSINEAEKIKIGTIARSHDCVPIRSTETIENLLSVAITQNFVPVIDDKDNFIGIITRKSIILSALEDLKDKNVIE